MWLTVAKVVELTKIPERSIRRYCNAHSVFIGARKEEGKPLQIPERSVDVLRQIRKMYQQGLDEKGVNSVLLDEAPQNIELSSTGAGPPLKITDAMISLKETMFATLERLKMVEDKLDNFLEERRRWEAREEEYKHKIQELEQRVSPPKEQKLLTRSSRRKKRNWVSRLFDSGK